MRYSVIALVFLAAACQQQPKPITFDGADVTDAAAIRAHGERLIHVLGCAGCHGRDLQGTFFTEDQPQYGPLFASNLTIQAPKFTDAELEGILRTGVHPERK